MPRRNQRNLLNSSSSPRHRHPEQSATPVNSSRPRPRRELQQLATRKLNKYRSSSECGNLRRPKQWRSKHRSGTGGRKHWRPKSRSGPWCLVSSGCRSSGGRSPRGRKQWRPKSRCLVLLTQVGLVLLTQVVVLCELLVLKSQAAPTRRPNSFQSCQSSLNRRVSAHNAQPATFCPAEQRRLLERGVVCWHSACLSRTKNMISIIQSLSSPRRGKSRQ